MDVIWDGSVYGVEMFSASANADNSNSQNKLVAAGGKEDTQYNNLHLLPDGAKGHDNNANANANTNASKEVAVTEDEAADKAAAALIRQIQRNHGVGDSSTAETFALPKPSPGPEPLPLYLIPSGKAAIYINMSSIFPSFPLDASTVTMASHDNPDVIGNAIVLQHHKVMIVLFQVDEDSKKRGRSVTNMRVEGTILDKEIQNENGTAINTTSHVVSIEFDLSTNAAGVDDVGEKGGDNTVGKAAGDSNHPHAHSASSNTNGGVGRVVIHVRNDTTTLTSNLTASASATALANRTADVAASMKTDAIVNDISNDDNTAVFLPTDLSAGVVRLTHNISRSRRLLGNRRQQHHRHGRHLLDIYGDSLVNVNMMYHARFGKASRKVPAHMPHMIDVDVMTELWDEYPAQFSKTSGRRFRGGEDMQFAFAHFYWLIHKVPERDLQRIWNHDLDVDGDGKLSSNELRSLAAIVEGKAPEDAAIREITACLRPPKEEELVEETLFGTVKMKKTTYPHATFGQFIECARAVNGVKDHWRVPPSHTIMTLDAVTFEMIGDDYNHTKEQLDGIRAKRTKFICVNDDMHNPSVELQDMLHDFYEALFAKPSPFELPPGERNPYLNTDKMRTFLNEKKKRAGVSREGVGAFMMVVILVVLMAVYKIKIK
jgi:hypothetical protein